MYRAVLMAAKGITSIALQGPIVNISARSFATFSKSWPPKFPQFDEFGRVNDINDKSLEDKANVEQLIDLLAVHENHMLPKSIQLKILSEILHLPEEDSIKMLFLSKLVLRCKIDIHAIQDDGTDLLTLAKQTSTEEICDYIELLQETVPCTGLSHDIEVEVY